MKKLLSIGFVLMMTVGLTACGDSAMTQEEVHLKMAELLNQVKMGKITQEEADKQAKEISQKMTKKQVKTETPKKKILNRIAEFKLLKECLVDADDKEDALDCHREMEGGGWNKEQDDIAAFNIGINEWTKKDKEKLIKQTNSLIQMMEN